MNNRVALLEAELNKARTLMEQGGATPGATPTAAIAPAVVTNGVSMEEFEKVKNELTEVYRRNSENSRQMIEMSSENKRLSDIVLEKDKQIADLQNRFKDAESEANSRDSTIKDKEKTMSVLKAELLSLQTKVLTTEGELRKANEEKEAVCTMFPPLLAFSCTHVDIITFV